MKEEHHFHNKLDEEYCDDCDKKFCWKCEDGQATLNLDKGEALCGECSAIAKAWDRMRKEEQNTNGRNM